MASVQFSSVAQSCPTLCDPMNRSTPGLPVHHQLQEFTQTHVHRVSDAIQPSHPLSPLLLLPPTPPRIRVFQWVNSSHEVAKVLESDTVSTVSPPVSHEVMGPDAMIFIFWMLSFKPTFSLSSFTFIKKLFSSSSLSARRRQWHPTPVLLPGKSHGWRILAGCSPWGR